jgi:hypothetical protein
MLVTTESAAWAVTFSAGLSTGVILGCGVTAAALGQVGSIAALAVLACAALVRRANRR